MAGDSGLNILLIEDSDDHAELARRAFARSRDEFSLVRAASCTEALKVLNDIHPVIIISDYLLPDGSGLNLYKDKIKVTYPDVPVLLLTSQGDEIVAVEALKSGMTDYIVKSDQVLISLPDVCRSIIRENNQKLENKRNVAALRESEERYRGILHAAIDGFWLADTQNRILEVNDAYCRMSGYSEEELLAMCIADLEARMTVDDIMTQIQKIVTKGESRFTSQHRRKDGSVFDVEVSIKYQSTDGGRLVAFFRDISERKAALKEKELFEQQLLHTQKLESLGVLAGGIAHDFNNILASIIGYCGLTQMDYGTAQNNIPKIEKAAERAAGLCRQMLAYAGKAQLIKSKINLVQEVDALTGMLTATLPRNAVINTCQSGEIPLIEG